MSKGPHDVIALMVKTLHHWLGINWVPKHITIGLFETFETSR